MQFDYNRAIQSGYSDQEIAQYLSQKKGFDYNRAVNSGYSDKETIDFLIQNERKDVPTDPQELEIIRPIKEGAKQVARSGLSFLKGGADYFKALDEQALQALSPEMRKAELNRRSSLSAPAQTVTFEPEDLQVISELAEQARQADILQPNLDYEKRKAAKSGVKRYIEDVIGLAPQIAAQVGTAVVGGVPASIGFMASQIIGSKQEQLEKQGVDPVRAFQAGMADAVMQAPLEAISMNKALKFWKPNQAIQKTLKNIASAMGTEFLTEWIQKYPEQATQIWAEAKQKKQDASEQVDEFINSFWDITKEGIYEGSIAMPFGGVVAGTGSIVSNKQLKQQQRQKEAQDIVAQDEQINNLQKLRDAGEISQDEYVSAMSDLGQEVTTEDVAPDIAVQDEKEKPKTQTTAERNQEIIDKISQEIDRQEYLNEIKLTPEERQELINQAIPDEAIERENFVVDRETALKELTEKQPQYKAINIPVSKAGINIKDVQQMFEGQNVGLSTDGNIWVKTKAGDRITIKNVENITPNKIAFQAAYNKMSDDGNFIAGRYQDKTIEINKHIGDKWTLAHESYHFLEDQGYITPFEQKLLKSHIRKLQGNKKWDTKNKNDIGGQEDRAFFIEEQLKQRSDAKQTAWLKRIINRLSDLIDGFVNVFKRTHKGIVRDIESGKVFERKQTTKKKSVKPKLPQYQYAGRKAQTADQSMYNKAIGMDLANADMETIRQTTGWFRGKYDKKWRFEIKDRQAKIKLKGKTWEDMMGDNLVMRLEDVYDHPELYKAYPYIKDMNIAKFNEEGAAYNPETKIIKIGNKTKASEVKPTLIHELQHAIQKFENFAKGGNLETAYDELVKKYKPYAKTLPAYKKSTDKDKFIYEFIRSQTKSGNINELLYPVYSRLAGEIEARDVFDKETRDFITPYSLENISEEDAITQFDSGIEAASLKSDEYFGGKSKTLIQRFAGVKDDIKDDDLITRFFDKMKPIQKLGKEIYQRHRLLNNAENIFSAWLRHGDLKFDKDKIFTIDSKNKGFLEWFKSLDNGEAFLKWVAAKRAAVLEKEGREAWFTKDKRDTIFKETYAENDPKALQMFAQFKKFNDNILDIAIESGLISKAQVKDWQTAFYLPFYREIEKNGIDQIKSPFKMRKVISAQIKRLKGAEQKIGDPLENVLRNWLHLIDQSQRNIARAKAYEYGKKSGLIKDVSNADIARMLGTFGKKKELNILTFQKDGKPVNFTSDDIDLIEALGNIEPYVIDNIFMRFARATKRLLTSAVTFSAAFKLANVQRDTLHTSIVSKYFIPFVDTVRGFKKAWADDPEMIKLAAAGGSFGQGYISGTDPKSMARFIKKVSKNDSKNILLRTPKEMLNWWERVGEAAEMAARVQLYTNLKAKGFSHLEAAYEARDLLDFALSGKSKTVQFLTQVLPFFNARMQGIYRLGRGYKDNKKAFFIKGLMLTAASLALWWAFKDDERYKELPDYDKWLYYHFWIGDVHIRIPKPFEIGAIFSSLPETVSNVVNGTEDIKHIGDFIGHTIFDTLAMNPIPQALKPSVEVFFNKNIFTGRDIIPYHLQRKPKSLQYDAWTSNTLKALGEKLNISPKQAEHLIKGYFSTYGLMALWGADRLYETMTDTPKTPAMNIGDYPGIGRFVKTEQRNTKYIQDFYETAQEIEEIVLKIRSYQITDDFDKAQETFNKNKSKIKKYRLVNKQRKVLAAVNNEIKKIWVTKKMTAKEKREAINKLTKKRNELAKQFYNTLK